MSAEEVTCRTDGFAVQSASAKREKEAINRFLLVSRFALAFALLARVSRFAFCLAKLPVLLATLQTTPSATPRHYPQGVTPL